MNDTKTTMAQIAALAGLGVEGEAGDLIANAVALLAERLPRGASVGAEDPRVEPKSHGPALQRLLKLTGWEVGEFDDREWVGPSYVERWASVEYGEGRATIWLDGGHNNPSGWYRRPITGDPMEAACEEILSRHDNGTHPLPCLDAPKPTADPRIGKWCRDSDGDEGVVVSTIGDDGGCFYAVGKTGNAFAMYYDISITTPPDPIPEPCRPAWEAFRALESRDG